MIMPTRSWWMGCSCWWRVMHSQWLSEGTRQAGWGGLLLGGKFSKFPFFFLFFHTPSTRQSSWVLCNTSSFSVYFHSRCFSLYLLFYSLSLSHCCPTILFFFFSKMHFPGPFLTFFSLIRTFLSQFRVFAHFLSSRCGFWNAHKVVLFLHAPGTICIFSTRRFS